MIDEPSLTVRAPTRGSTAAKWATSDRWRVRNGGLIAHPGGDRLDVVLVRHGIRRIEPVGLGAAIANDQIRQLLLDSCSGPPALCLTWVIDGCVFDTRDALDAQLLRLVVVLNDTMTKSRGRTRRGNPPTS